MPSPAPHQVEVTLFGPGYGESSVIHLGSGNWIVIDSCIDSETRAPAALSYLQSIGVDPVGAVKLIVATHWHDDHIGGMAELVGVCTNAEFCSSSAYSTTEFLAAVTPFTQRNSVAGGSGVKELMGVLNVLGSRSRTGRNAIRATANRCIWRLPTISSGHGADCKVWTLSPSDRQIESFLLEAASLIPSIGETKRRLSNNGPNHTAVVTWVEIGDVRILLGADLEETKDPDTGWSVIVSSPAKPGGKAVIFKVPHHGSSNAHSDMVWADMVEQHSYAILTPYNRGRKKLPSPPDVGRILGFTPNSYSTAKRQTSKSTKRRPYSVEKTIRETVGKIRSAEPKTGSIRLRCDNVTHGPVWQLDLINGATHLDSI